MNLRCCK
jgi:hypothetical protein